MTLTRTIPSFLYWQYKDDDDLQAFVRAYNEQAQDFVDWFNYIDLPIYTSSRIAGPLLDWVAEGLYGMERPSLPLGRTSIVGPFNTYELNTLPFNVLIQGDSGGASDPNYYSTTDDIFRRILTWHFYKGDGKVFDIRWLKRRIMRFLYGTDGIDYGVSQTYQISITFGGGSQAVIGLKQSQATVVKLATLNGFGFNRLTFNGFLVTVAPLPEIPNAELLKSAIDSGVLELPFQWSWEVITT